MSECPLVSPYTKELQIKEELLEKLFLIRKWDTENGGPIPFIWPSRLRKTIWDTVNDRDTGEPLILRQYQIQQIIHMTRMPAFINGDAVGLGKTLDVIASACWLKDRFPDAKIVIVGTKSVTWQWYDEFKRFSTLKPYVMRDNYKGKTSYEARYAQMEAFLAGKNIDVMIIKYTSMIGARKKIEGQFDENGIPVKKDKREVVSAETKQFARIFKKHKDNLILCFDESHKFKGQGTAIRALAMYLSHFSGKTWALTATAIQNGLDEFYSIATAIGLTPFGAMADFYDMFCVFRDQYVGHGITKQVLMGYKEVPRFRAGIRPFFLGRSQAQVKEKLPLLTTIYHPVDLDDRQVEILTDELPNGTIQLPPTIIKVAGEIYEKERDPDNLMTRMSVQQLVANHWALLDKNNEKDYHTKKLSPKEEALLDMLDGDFRGEKVIVYTKYKTWIDRLQWLTEHGHFTDRKFLRITGDESERKRAENKQQFQSSTSGYDLIVVNAAGVEGINLQQAAHMVLLDLPWSWGSLIQLVGRMVRMASPHSACTLHIIPAKGTIDEYTVETLKGKKGVFEKILGESHSAGILENNALNLDSGMESGASDEEFLSLLKAHVKSTSMTDFLGGDKIVDAQQNENYAMSFEKKPRLRKKKGWDEDLFEAKW